MIEQRTSREIEAALARGDVGTAAVLAEAALAAGQDDPMLLNLGAWAREEARDYDGARALLDQALASAPDDPTIVAAIGTVLRKQGRYADALRMLDRATALAPGYMVPWLERGYAFDAASSLHRAAESFAKAIALEPMSAPALSGFASVAARLGNFDEARAHAARALEIDPADATALRVTAAADLDAGKVDSAVAILKALLGRSDLGSEERITALTLLGDAFNKRNAADEAFAAWGAAKSAFAAFYAPHFAAGQETHQALVERLTAELVAIDPAAWTAPPQSRPEGARNHGFVLGFPRSGNTLAENILASAPGVATLEEAPTTLDADEAFLKDPGGLARLAAIGASEAEELRATYWRRVASLGAELGGGAAFVDSDPLKSIKLPIVAKLFPDARVMVLLRDPRDIVLSCYRLNFVANAATYEFTSLERIARHYDAVMRLLTASIDVLPLHVRLVRYADLVSDFDTVTKGMCDFLGVAWSPAMRDFNRTAKARNVGTASVAQVRRGLFNGTGQWRRYAAQLAPVQPILAPWLERFGMMDD